MNNFDIATFLQGRDSTARIVYVDAFSKENKASIYLKDKDGSSIIKSLPYTPFAFIKDFKEEGVKFYATDEAKQKAITNNGITVKKLDHRNHPKLYKGYKYLVTSNKSFKHLLNFFKNGGIDVYDSNETKRAQNKNLVVLPNRNDMVMMQYGLRFYKEMNLYKNVHKLYFDIETSGLDPKTDKIFLIGLRDNRGYERIIDGTELGATQPDEIEKHLIEEFFKEINNINPDIIGGYNSENFDFDFITVRAELRGVDPNEILKNSLFSEYGKAYNRMPSMIKLGAELEEYVKTTITGITVVDFCHYVRKAMQLDRSIKSWSLKYITKKVNATKSNRMYLDGSKIYSYWKENSTFLIHKKDNKYIKFSDDRLKEPRSKLPENKEWIYKFKDFIVKCEPNCLKDKENNFKGEQFLQFLENSTEEGLTALHNRLSIDFELISSKEIVTQYLYDDLYETEKVDEIFGQAYFYMSKLLPTNFSRVVTMGNSAMWTAIMQEYSYMNNLAIPHTTPKTKMTGGLNRLLVKGFTKRVVKVDFSGLYPSLQLWADIFPNSDVDRVLKQCQIYMGEKRDYHKKMMKECRKNGDEDGATYHEYIQLPFKILRNAQFGSISSAAIFCWGDMICGEKITTFGRQHLRLMVQFFIKKGCFPLVMNTDGCNFSVPENLNPDDLIDEYNMFLQKMTNGIMKVDNDGFYESTINLGKNNYANMYVKDVKKELTLVGGSLIGTNIEKFVIDTIKKGIELLLEDKGRDFVELYNKRLKEIYYRKLPLGDIVSKAKVKELPEDYLERITNNTNAKGNKLPRQTHMELIIQHNLKVNLGDVVYYYNSGTKKSHSDTKYGILVKEEDLDKIDSSVEYNLPLYISKFNKRITPLLCVFKEEIADKILVTNPDDIIEFTDDELALTSQFIDLSGVEEDKVEINEEGLLDDKSEIESSLESIFTMTEQELKFWQKANLNPSFIFEDFILTEDTKHIYDLIKENTSKFNHFKNHYKDKLKLFHEFYSDGDYVYTLRENSKFLVERFQKNKGLVKIYDEELDL